MKPQLRLSQKQRLGLTQSMQTSLRILRMNSEEIHDEIAREVMENPFIELHGNARTTLSYDAALDRTVSETGLFRSLAQQIATQRLSDTTARIALFLAGELRSDGYLDVSLDDLADNLKLPLPELELGLTALQGCDPPGIGARTLHECLVIQLVDAGIRRDWAATAIAQLDDFRDGKWARLQRLQDWSRTDLDTISDLLRGLSPVPVAPDSQPDITRIPDLLADRGPGGQISLSLNPDALPRISLTRIDPALSLSGEVASHYRRATELHNALKSRARTLLRIGRLVLASQEGFFRGGEMSIVPLSRRQAATQLDMHPATLGRAIRGKSVLVGGTTYPLAQFFQSALRSTQGEISAHDVQRRVKALIRSEDPASPLADEMICTQLRNEGVDIARRTVAKYRKCMRIPSSFERRRQKGRRDARTSRAAPDEFSGH